jgi:2-polyprenyl-6-methoxyphenol hydroxylase-like FAD-dependent oxidoreductase
VLLLPTTPAGRCRVVALVDGPELPAWQAAGEEDLAELLATRSPRLRGLEVERAHGSHVYRLAAQHAERYVAPGLALLGDAAHVVHPNGGQGMALAVHDAAALADLVAPALHDGCGDPALAVALAAYERRRRAANARALARADRASLLGRPNRLAYAAALAALGVFSLAPGLLARLYSSFGAD